MLLLSCPEEGDKSSTLTLQQREKIGFWPLREVTLGQDGGNALLLHFDLWFIHPCEF